MARLSQTAPKTGKTILLVDDQEDYLMATTTLLEREGHDVVTAVNGPIALELMKSRYFDLVLLDFYMPGNMTGEEIVIELRKFNPYAQVILQTGYAGELPPREMFRRLDIQGYHDKSDGPDRLLLWVDAGLKSAYVVQLLNKSRMGLRYILDVTPDLHKMQPVEELLQGILFQISGLLGVVDSFLAVVPAYQEIRKHAEHADGFVAFLENNSLFISVATGKYHNIRKLDNEKDGEMLKLISEVLRTRTIKSEETFTLLPLIIGELTIGVVYLDQNIHKKIDLELLYIFANQASVAIHNARLYEMATTDNLTGVFVRRYFEQWLLRELRTAFRTKTALSLVMVDMDKFKTINDTAGHLAGDQALVIMGDVLKKATRTSDTVARYGGDEFAIILPQTPLENIEIVGRRIQEYLADKFVEGPDGNIPLKASIGIGRLQVCDFDDGGSPKNVPQEYFEKMAKALVHKADTMLYEAKTDKANKLKISELTPWLPLP